MENVTQLKKNFNKSGFDIGAHFMKVWSWYLIDTLFFKSGIIPFSNILVLILRLYGAEIGKDVRIKPGIRITYPWKLCVGDCSWLATCYIDNLEHVVIGKNVCISQEAMLLTGNHNYKSSSFDLIARAILIEDGAWIGARALVCPGVVAASHSVLTAGSIATCNMERYMIYQGNPAVAIRKRKLL
jgi:putative colanic acid biosynthesis acetyltransferase WcaF